MILTAVVLTAGLGRITYAGHEETWYNLPMGRVLERAAAHGIEIDYWERSDGMKMNGKYIICAGNYKVYPYGSLVETSRGTGIILDTGDFIKDHPNDIDLSVTWER
jgi:3D (Asp-Asp-Asp) domain-containing protein